MNNEVHNIMLMLLCKKHELAACWRSIASQQPLASCSVMQSELAVSFTSFLPSYSVSQETAIHPATTKYIRMSAKAAISVRRLFVDACKEKNVTNLSESAKVRIISVYLIKMEMSGF